MKPAIIAFWVLVFAQPLYAAASRENARARAAAATPAQTAAQARSTATVSRAAAPQQAQQIQPRSAIQTMAPTRATAARAAAITAAAQPKRLVAARAAVPVVQPSATTMGDGYVQCREAYFACMDQFCALRNEQYRRCTCSGRLVEMRERERNFSTATSMLKDFEDVNLYAVDKSAREVKAMQSASEGEAAIKRDNSASARALGGISGVLASKSGNDAADNMGSMTDIWGTVNMVGGADLATLESTALYNAVHVQCAEMVAEQCGRVATFNMVAAAYGMYIEQDCSAYADSLDKNQRQLTMTTKQAQGALAAARLQNYDNHNSEAITSCLSKVRKDMFGDGACGPDNVKCVDNTGRFVDITTGAPIYTPDFWMLEKAISLSGDTLKNNHNMPYINMLNQKKPAAAESLDRCRDVADDVWDEYLRQTLIDLSQKQFATVRAVQNECIGIVNQCYDEKLEQLRQFASDISQENVGAQQAGLTEVLCRQQLETCAMLYGGGPPGLEKLRQYVRNSQTVNLEDNCEKYLTSYVGEICTPINDTMRGFPYQCRFYNPGQWWPDPDDVTENTLYDRIRSKATDVCTRQDADTWTHEVRMIINKIMDDVKLKMDFYLETECNNVGGTWHSRTLGSWETAPDDEAANISDFYERTGANEKWGICLPSCPANSTYNPKKSIATNGTTDTHGVPVAFCECNNKGAVQIGGACPPPPATAP